MLTNFVSLFNQNFNMMTRMKMTTYLFTLVAMIILASCNKGENDSPTITYTSPEVYLKEIGFNGSVLIRKNGADLLRRGFGIADHFDSTLNQTSLIYRIGSITKSFTAAAVIHLMRDGLIYSFDQKLSDFSADFPFGNQITIRDLMTHHSGIPDYVGPVEEYAEENNYYFDRDEIFEIIEESILENGLLFIPGEYFSYSNSNYFILGVLIEELTGKSYEEYLQLKLFTPLNLINTSKGPDQIQGVDRAKGYYNGLAVSDYQMQIAFSAGELESTIADLEKWGDVMMSNYFTIDERQILLAPSISQSGVNVPGSGWFTLNTNNQVIYHHGGDIDGFTSLLVFLPKFNGLIILLSNEQDKSLERQQIMEVIIQNEF